MKYFYIEKSFFCRQVLVGMNVAYQTLVRNMNQHTKGSHDTVHQDFMVVIPPDTPTTIPHKQLKVFNGDI